MRYFAAFIIVCCTSFAEVSIADDMLLIVTHRNNPLKTISFETLKQVFLRKTLLDSNGNRWIPLNLPVSHDLRRDFYLALFNKSPEDLEEYWNEQYFHGINPPEVLASEEAVLRFIEKTPGAIGYLSKGIADERVKVLTILPVPKHNDPHIANLLH